MLSTDLQGIADAVVRRAQQQGYVLPREVRQELAQAGVAEGQWKEVVALARPALHYRHGRYYYQPPVSPRLEQERLQQQSIRRAVRELIRHHRADDSRIDRRLEERVDFIQPVTVLTEDQRSYRLLSRDLSPTGIRLVGTRRLLGQKVRVLIPRGEGVYPWCFLVRILWTCAIGDDLFENGGNFLDVTLAEPG